VHQRIHRRVDDMFRLGLVSEVQNLLQTYGHLSRTAIQAVGYRESVEHLSGKYELATAIERTRTRTRRLARRQDTWFRSLPELRHLAMQDEPSEVTAQRIVSLVRAGEQD
jgi:tRNA dimethylallyltransferase